MRKTMYLLATTLALVLIAGSVAVLFRPGMLKEDPGEVVYTNHQYGFRFELPQTWRGYSIIEEKWEGFTLESDGNTESGPLISIRHPLWTTENPRQDIPIMVFATEQWNALQEDKFHIGAAPMNPRKLEQNNRYVFALPARYNYAFPTGYEEVDQIIESNPLQALPD